MEFQRRDSLGVGPKDVPSFKKCSSRLAEFARFRPPEGDPQITVADAGSFLVYWKQDEQRSAPSRPLLFIPAAPSQRGDPQTAQTFPMRRDCRAAPRSGRLSARITLFAHGMVLAHAPGSTRPRRAVDGTE